MSFVSRKMLAMVESVFYGFTYAALRELIRQPEPLDPESTWTLINRELPPFLDWWRLHYPPRFMRRLLLAARMKQEHLLGISEHYDVSNDFYRLFLDDKYMFYSCADFVRGDETLEEAQTAKADFLLRLIAPRRGEEILDLGCGWGPMLKRIQEETGDTRNLHGYTLSQEQVVYCREHYQFDVEFKNFVTCSYPKEAFHKIFSIGAWEHVRHRDLQPLVMKLFAALKPGGRMVKHFFCPRSETVPVAAIAAQIFFPGSFQPAYPTQVRAFEKAGFRISHQSIHDYRPTLRAWFDNLVRNKERAIKLVGVPTYNKYIVFFPASHRFFNDSESILVRFSLEKPDGGSPP